MAVHEECGVFGLISPESADLAGVVYYGALCFAAPGTGELWNRGE